MRARRRLALNALVGAMARDSEPTLPAAVDSGLSEALLAARLELAAAAEAAPDSEDPKVRRAAERVVAVQLHLLRERKRTLVAALEAVDGRLSHLEQRWPTEVDAVVDAAFSAVIEAGAASKPD